MPSGRISKRAVDALECTPEKERIFLWDEALAGFGACAMRSGKKSYVVQFRSNGRSRRIALGDHGRLTPEEARSAAKKLLGAVENGNDPIEERQAARAVNLFREVAADFMELHIATKRKPRTKADYTLLLSRHILPALGRRRMTDIRRVDVAKMHAAISRNAPVAANRAIALFSAIWEWAGRRELVASADNPARGLERNPEERCERFLTPEEFARLGDALRLAETSGLPWQVEDGQTSKHLAKAENRLTVADPYAVAAIRLLILTGARLREILNSRWEWVDLSRGVMFLPTSKTGKKPLYLSAAAQSVLAGVRRVDGNPYIIAGAKAGGHRVDLNKPWNAIRRAAGLADLRIHDLRHSFASVGAGTSLGLPIIGRLLGHSQPATTARYAHLDADPMRRAADTIGASIMAAMERDKSKPVAAFRVRK
jgi:integrase